MRDPVTGVSATFAPMPSLSSKQIERMYFELAITHWISFREIFRMLMMTLHGPEAADKALNGGFDLEKELRLGVEDGKQDTKLLKHFDLPPEELLEIWMRSRRQLQRLAEFSNFSPARRERIERFLAESEAEMFAILERHEHQPRKGNANGKE